LKAFSIRGACHVESNRSCLFAADALPFQPAYDVGAVRERLEAALGKMRAAAGWPWKDSTAAHYREAVWPSLLKKLLDAAEAARLKAEMKLKWHGSTLHSPLVRISPTGAIITSPSGSQAPFSAIV
jgi:hypothetical protein